MGRKLKGTTVEKLPTDNKKKMKETLDRMDKIREDDNSNLRDLIKGKLAWAITEKQKGLSQLEKLKIQINRLEGIILFCQDILSPQPENE